MKIFDYLTGQEKGQKEDALAPLSQEHRERRELMALLWRYYRGQHRKHLRVSQGQADDNVIVNYSRRVVDKGAYFLFGKDVIFEADGIDEGRLDEDYLAAAWGGIESKATLLQSIAINGGVCGHAFVRIFPADSSVPGALPRLVNLDPSALDVVTADDDIEDVRGYRVVWKAGDVWKRHSIDQDGQGWMIVEQEGRANSQTWVTVAEQEWPWDFAPIAACQNLPNPNQFWGISDLEEADLNDAINFTASNINRILRFHAHPKTIGTGFDASVLQATAVEQFWTIPNEGSNVFNLEMQSDLASSQEFLSFLKTAYSKVTSVPELDPDQVNVGALSGFALRILYGDLLEKTNAKRNTYGRLLADINHRMLVISGSDVEQVKNVWQGPLPDDEVAQTQALAQDRSVGGLSRETYLERRGYNVEREAKRLAAEEAQTASATDNLGSFLLRSFDRGER